MTDRDDKRLDAGCPQENDALRRGLDEALAKYAAVEPRAGLEDRVLANLRAERAKDPNRAWWPWSVAAALVALLVVVAALAWRPGKPPHPVIANHPPSTVLSTQEPGKQVVSNGGANRNRPQRPGTARTRPQQVSQLVTEAHPKLDQFPSPQPLSEQEKILANYVAEYPEHAVLLARARSEALRRDQLEEIRAFPSDDQATDSAERNNHKTER